MFLPLLFSRFCWGHEDLQLAGKLVPHDPPLGTVSRDHSRYWRLFSWTIFLQTLSSQSDNLDVKLRDPPPDPDPVDAGCPAVIRCIATFGRETHLPWDSFLWQVRPPSFCSHVSQQIWGKCIKMSNSIEQLFRLFRLNTITCWDSHRLSCSWMPSPKVNKQLNLELGKGFISGEIGFWFTLYIAITREHICMHIWSLKSFSTYPKCEKCFPLAQFETSGVKVIFDNFCVTSMACPWSSRCIWCTASCILVRVEKSQVVGPWETFQTSMLNMLWSKVFRENMTENRFQEFQSFPIWWNTWFHQVVYII